jgi:hypothetical protein
MIAADLPLAVYKGTADVVETSQNNSGDTTIKVIYARAAMAALHTTAWTTDLKEECVWNQVSPTLKRPNDSTRPVDPVRVAPGEQYIQFWAQAAGDFPPVGLKVPVAAGTQTTIVVDYTLDTLKKDTGSVAVGSAVAGGTPAGYGKLQTLMGTLPHSTSWSIDGGSWRTAPSVSPHVTVYATNHTIQYKVNEPGHTAPPSHVVPVPSTKLVPLTINYTNP